jgi:AcrR family transcriptional regulator
MRKASWGGSSPPGDDTEARRRLIEATRRCIERFGPERVTLGDVAEEAGVTRPTVYRYFGTGEDLLRAAFVVATGGILERTVVHARSFGEAGERLVEGFVYLWREIPADPHLGPIFTHAEEGRRARSNLLSELSLEVGSRLLRSLSDDWGGLKDEELDEFLEILIRLLDSFLLEPGPEPRDEDELRAFLRRWVLPMTGLPR